MGKPEMNNQTIDGVPRELLGDLLKIASRKCKSAWSAGICDELRALLDAPAKDYVFINGMRFSHAEILEWREKACADMEKAAQSQGEPVAMVRTHGSECWEEITGESLEMCRAQPEEYEVRMLYGRPAEQPAPVAVVLPERDESFGTAERDEYGNGYRHGWNAYHDAAQERLNSGTKP